MESRRDPPTAQAHRATPDWMSVAQWTRLGVRVVAIAVAAAVTLLTVLAIVGAPGPSSVSQAGRSTTPDGVLLDILPVRPGGPAENYAAYTPSTMVSAPADSLVSVTIRNFDLDATPLPAGSPYVRVQGTVGGVAYADGVAYSSLALMNVAHTFTVPALGLNVPIPGHSSTRKRYVTVTFQMRTGKAGAYAWRCFAPCGDGPDGQAGAMADDLYMRGTLVVTK